MSPSTCSGCRARSRVIRVPTSGIDRCALATSGLGLGAVLRRGLARRGGRYPVWAHDGSVAAARRLRCDARATRAAAVPPSAALNAPRTSRRPRRSGASGAGLPLASLRFSPPHKSPTPGTTHRARTLAVFGDVCRSGAGKAAGGYAPAATYATPRSAGLRGLRVALRRRAGHTLFEHRAQRRCASSVAPARGRVCVAALAARAPQGSRSEAEAAAFERRRIPGRGFARSICARAIRSFVADGTERNGPMTCSP